VINPCQHGTENFEGYSRETTEHAWALTWLTTEGNEKRIRRDGQCKDLFWEISQ
jgi:hypothetical protein